MRGVQKHHSKFSNNKFGPGAVLASDPPTHHGGHRFFFLPAPWRNLAAVYCLVLKTPKPRRPVGVPTDPMHRVCMGTRWSLKSCNRPPPGCERLRLESHMSESRSRTLSPATCELAGSCALCPSPLGVGGAHMRYLTHAPHSPAHSVEEGPEATHLWGRDYVGYVLGAASKEGKEKGAPKLRRSWAATGHIARSAQDIPVDLAGGSGSRYLARGVYNCRSKKSRTWSVTCTLSVGGPKVCRSSVGSQSSAGPCSKRHVFARS
jgi:hypothetical protein